MESKLLPQNLVRLKKKNRETAQRLLDLLLVELESILESLKKSTSHA